MESFKEVGGWTFILGCPRKLVEGVLGCFRNLEVPRQRDADDALPPPHNLLLAFWGILVVGLGWGWKSKEVGVGGRIGAM